VQFNIVYERSHLFNWLGLYLCMFVDPSVADSIAFFCLIYWVLNRMLKYRNLLISFTYLFNIVSFFFAFFAVAEIRLQQALVSFIYILPKRLKFQTVRTFVGVFKKRSVFQSYKLFDFIQFIKDTNDIFIKGLKDYF